MSTTGFYELLSLAQTYWPALTCAALIGLWFCRGLFRSLVGRVFGFHDELESLASKKKSSEVRYGKLGEVLAPLAEAFPVDIRAEGSTTVFLGQPVDYLHFAADGSVHFIEIKTGNARLAAVQQRIKKAIEDGRVQWDDVRIE